MSTEQQLLDQAVARVEERADALAAHHKLPGIKQVVGIAVTLDGAFDVAAQLMDEEYHREMAGLFTDAMVACLRNALHLAGVPDGSAYEIAKDVMGIVKERRDAQDQIQRMYDAQEGDE